MFKAYHKQICLQSSPHRLFCRAWTQITVEHLWKKKLRVEGWSESAWQQQKNRWWKCTYMVLENRREQCL